MDLGRFFAAACVVVVVIPWGLKSLSNGNINLNGLLLDFAETVTEIITRNDANFSQPKPPSNDQGL